MYLSFIMSLHTSDGYEHVAMNLTRLGLAAATIGNTCRFNTIITSLKAPDESFSSRNHVRKFFRALLTKWRPKVTVIEESKDLSTLSLNELIDNLKVYEVVLEKDSKVSKSKKETYKSLALKARKVSSDEGGSCSDSDDEEYSMAVRDFKKFFRRIGKFVRQPHDDKKNFRKVRENKKEKADRRCFKCVDLNYFISDCPKHSFNDQKAFVVGCWSDSEKDTQKGEIWIMAHDSNEVQLKVKLEPDEWIKDSGCSRYMMGNNDLFLSYKAIDGESKDVKEAIQNESWTMAMQEELNQFKTNDAWSLVAPPNNQTIIDYVDLKNTSDVCIFMGCCLTSWFSKKQTALAISTTKAEYVFAEKACQQPLWMKQSLVNYDIVLDDRPIFCDNKGAIDLSKNLILYTCTKHIEICHHFLCDNVQKGNISIEKVSFEDNIVNILTKPLK
uniref:Copia protein n=1 Tax=Tanacetum cinerariifolium TaxID=118510 RepID=A0A6L2M1U2_TANCI|nr:copia protein [Tanacetum cinerariifolium]